MAQADYEYRDGALWVRLTGPAAEAHAELLKSLAVVLAELGTEPGGFAPGILGPLFGLLITLTPTAEHLKGN